MAARWAFARCSIAAVALFSAAGSAMAFGRGDPLPVSELAVDVDGVEDAIVWWRSTDAPTTWSSPLPIVTRAVRWHDPDAAVSWGELSLRGTGEARHTRVILVRIDPRRVRLHLDSPPLDLSANDWLGPPKWSIASAPARALVALNAGQFTSGGAWGLIVRKGREIQPPRPAPLAPGILVDRTGAVSIVPASALDSAGREGGIVEGFQSYPSLLDHGRVPKPLRRGGLGIDVTHRDARLALGILHDGSVLVALTRFDALGGILDRLPFGLTTPEMAALMGAFGCHSAVLLDGGVSGQLLVRDSVGDEHRWPGMRHVPLGLTVEPR